MSVLTVGSTVCRIPIKLGSSYLDGELTSQEVPFGDVSDPSYPKHRPVDCTWEIYTDQGNSVSFSFVIHYDKLLFIFFLLPIIIIMVIIAVVVKSKQALLYHKKEIV